MARKKEPEVVELPVTFIGGGDDPQTKLQNVLAAKQSPAYPLVQELLHDAVPKRVAVVQLDCSVQGVAVRYQIDGLWHNIGARPRDAGDAMVQVIKKIANLRPEDRRSKQDGKCEVQISAIKKKLNIVTQGVQTGEHVHINIEPEKSKLESLEDLGVRDKIREKWKEFINAHEGFVLVSAAPENGLPTLWKCALNASDRFLRDFVSIERVKNKAPEVINVAPIYYDPDKGEKAPEVIDKAMLKQPEVILSPELADGDTVNKLSELCQLDHKLVGGSIRAKDCAEALLRVLMLKPKVDLFAKSITCVINQRLVRKLCDKCKQQFQPHPQILQKLGIPPGRVPTFYKQWEPPPPDPDPKKKQEEPEICKKCQGLGYHGRTGFTEMLIVDDKIREALVKQPKLEVIRLLAKQSGQKSLQDEAILLFCLGVTSLPEIQRVLK